MLDPVLMEIAATLAGKAAGGLYDLVRSAFGRHPEAGRELVAVQGAEPDSAPVRALATRLAEFEAADPDFARRLRAEWASVTVAHADHGGVTNQITGNVTGKVVQARDIHGDISF
jgi:hypothetical protein